MACLEVTPKSRSVEHDQSSAYIDLHATKTKLENIQEDEPRFAPYFEAWSRHRKGTIKTLVELLETTGDVFKKCNRGREVGAAAGVIGGLTGILAFVLKLKGIETGPLLQGSGLCAGAGAATFLASELIEAGLTEDALDEIKKVVEKDIRLTEPIRRYVQFSHEVNESLHKMLQCRSPSDYVEVMKMCRHCIKQLDSGRRKVVDLLRELRDNNSLTGIGNLPTAISRSVINFLNQINRNPNLIDVWRRICEIFTNTPSISTILRKGAAISYQVNEIVKPLYFTPANFCTCAFNAILILCKIFKSISSIKETKKLQSEFKNSLDHLVFALQKELDEVTKTLNERELDLKYDDLLELRDLTLASP